MRTRCLVNQLDLSNGNVAAVRLDGGDEVRGDYYVLAVPFDRLVKLVPEEIGRTEMFTNLSLSPITGVHMWFDRPVMNEPFLTSIDHAIQWIFNRTNQYIQVVISASRDLANRSQQEIVDVCRHELNELLPAAKEASLLRAVVIRENSATFSPAPGCDRWRPSQRTVVRNLFLAGDWTNTGWPATMESAVRSGYQAAEAILASQGSPASVVQPDMPTTGLARWFVRA